MCLFIFYCLYFNYMGDDFTAPFNLSILRNLIVFYNLTATMYYNIYRLHVFDINKHVYE